VKPDQNFQINAEGGQESLPPCCAGEDDGGTPVPWIGGDCNAVLGGERNEQTVACMCVCVCLLSHLWARFSFGEEKNSIQTGQKQPTKGLFLPSFDCACVSSLIPGLNFSSAKKRIQSKLGKQPTKGLFLPSFN
jgi:hypothetical protein